jgi:N-acetylmuramoyl-L-alanine amidase
MAKKICLDAGHYGKYNRSPAVPAYYESDMNWKLHLLLKAALEKYGFEVKLTRSNQAKDLALIERGKAAKGCDLFLSIHSNAVDGKVHEDVDYPVSIVPINGTGVKLGKQLAECVASVMVTKQKADCWSKKSTSGTANWHGVIHGAALVGVTGIILEHSFHTNTRSTKWLMDESNLQKMAQREAEVIANYFGVKPKEETKTEQTAKPEQAAKSDDVWYLVSLGAYSDPNNAKAMLAKAKAAGFKDAYITTKPKD